MARSTNGRRARVAVLAVAAASGAALVTAGSALGHASVQLYGGTASAGGFGALWMRIPHGCSGAPTDRVEIRVPKSFPSVKPQYLGGWKASTKRLKSGITVLTWRAKDDPLPDDQFADFGISVAWPEKAGAYGLPTVQHCGKDRVAWTQAHVEGQEEPEHPTPTVTVGEATATDHHG